MGISVVKTNRMGWVEKRGRGKREVKERKRKRLGDMDEKGGR